MGIFKNKRVIAVIPARMDSTRFPGKILADILGKPMIQHVWGKTLECNLIDKVYVATDSQEIKSAVHKFGGEVIMTSKEHKSGTDRIAQACKLLEFDYVVNVQGDEPLLDPQVLQEVVQYLQDNPKTQYLTIAKPTSVNDASIENQVYVVCDLNDHALYFSRSKIPNCSRVVNKGQKILKHIGLYAYSKEFLEKFSGLDQTPLEKIEKLEQLRALENGYKIKVLQTNFDSVGVDVPEDLEEVKRIMTKAGN